MKNKEQIDLMLELLKLIKEVGLFVEEDKGEFKGNSLNVKSYPVFRLWINKSGNMTVKTRGVQKSFKEWQDLECFKSILKGFEVI